MENGLEIFIDIEFDCKRFSAFSKEKREEKLYFHTERFLNDH